MKSLDKHVQLKLSTLESKKLLRKLTETNRSTSGITIRDNKKLISFACNDYLGLSQNPDVIRAIKETSNKYGAGAGASRLVTGNNVLYKKLENQLADLKGTERACVFGSGYLANLGIIPSLVGPKDLIVTDQLSHACIFAGADLAESKILTFQHNDINNLEGILKRERSLHQHVMVVTDGVFSMDGDLAPIPELSKLCKKYDAWLMTDDAHGIGVLGNGRGSNFAFESASEIPLQMGTLSKAVGSYGGYLCASKSVIELIKTRARTLIYSTALPPAIISASISALNIIKTNPELTKIPLKNAQFFTSILKLDKAVSPIVPIILGDPERAMNASKILENKGYLVTAIRPPTVPEGTARLRFAFSSEHKIDDIENLAKIVKKNILCN
ncbi:MAG: 8-amino-7-oxononanoate synthase [Alphaproteobacteria bacterium]|nr:8-amino-7-oxononanoate synthase [Alphaproteobacteria bacterium]|tara:strand:- start:464 stop:1618 length:1155 start_codon:yes stop_codon:yes gene_type:complete